MIQPPDIPHILKAMQEAGQAIMMFYQDQHLAVEFKADASPVTSADQASNRILLDALAAHYPHVPVISEESALPSWEERQHWPWCWLVDPLDGTREFLKHNGEFSVNLALIHQHQPIAGFIHFPVQNCSYYALLGEGAYKAGSDGQTKRLGKHPAALNPAADPYPDHPELLHIMISRSHAGQDEYAFIKRLRDAGFGVQTHPHGSAMKHCLLAEGKGDLYAKFGTCSEWDTAPGQLILEEAGGSVTRHGDGLPLEYNKESMENPGFFMWGLRIRDELRNQILQAET